MWINAKVTKNKQTGLQYADLSYIPSVLVPQRKVKVLKYEEQWSWKQQLSECRKYHHTKTIIDVSDIQSGGWHVWRRPVSGVPVGANHHINATAASLSAAPPCHWCSCTSTYAICALHDPAYTPNQGLTRSHAVNDLGPSSDRVRQASVRIGSCLLLQSLRAVRTSKASECPGTQWSSCIISTRCRRLEKMWKQINGTESSIYHRSLANCCLKSSTSHMYSYDLISLLKITVIILWQLLSYQHSINITNVA